MGKSSIEWTDETWNPVTGCSKVSQGCKNCYAEVMAKRLKAMGRPEYQDAVDDNGRWTGKMTVVKERISQPLNWKKPRMVFVNSMSDLFHESLAFEDIRQIFQVMALANSHTFQVLTKRPEQAVKFFDTWQYGTLPPNIWIGVSVENQEAADDRIPLLLTIPAKVKFLSCEPLLGPLNIQGYLLDGWHKYSPKIHWVIAGGESGHSARPMHPDWARSIRRQCNTAGTAFFFKQWGEWMVSSHMKQGIHRDPGIYSWPWKDGGDFTMMVKVGKKAAGAVLDGEEWREFPEVER